MLSNGYIYILLWAALTGFISVMVSGFYRMENVNGERVKRTAPLFAVFCVAPLVIWAGYRGNVGDTAAYKQFFGEMPSAFSGISGYMSEMDKDRGFYFVSAVVKCIIGNREILYFIIIAAVQCFLLFRIYRKYSVSFTLSFFLFLVSTDYVSWMFNGTRQFVAVTITVACFPWILEKKYLRAVLGILFASLFHQSALLVLPFVFIVQGKAWNKKTLLFICLVIAAVVFVDRFTDILETVLAETQYDNVVADWTDLQDDGTNVLRVLVYSIPLLLSLVGFKIIRQENDAVINICVNMAIATTGLYVISMFTSGVYIGRLPIYFSLYNYILLPWEIKHIFTERSQRLIHIMMVGAYLLFYYYQMHFTWNII